MLPAQPNQSLIDGLTCLQALAVESAPVGVRELARRLELEPTRTGRLIKTLAHLGLAEQTADRKYTIGPAVHLLSAQVLHASGLVRRAIGPLETLHEFGHIVAMGVLWQTQVCYIYFASPGADLAEALGSRSPHPATQSGIGMALLAGLGDAEIRQRYRSQPIPGFADVKALLDELKQVRKRGYASHDVVLVPGRRTIAVPIGSPAYAAVGLSGEIDRRRTSTIVKALTQTAAVIDGQTET